MTLPRRAAPFLAAFLLSCASGEEVARRRGDVLEHGRRVDALAYAWYVRAAHHERRGDFSQAAHDYRAALSHDSASGSAWAALGRVLCRADIKEAERTFERGLRNADRHAPIYTELGLCRLSKAGANQHLVSKACEDLAQAMKLEPHSAQASEIYAKCLRQSGRTEAAARQERAQKLFFDGPAPPPPEPTPGAVDRALLASDLTKAQDLALELMSPGALSARAALLGQNELARTQAELVLRASPADADANVTLVALGEDLRPASETLRDLSPPGLLLLFKVIERKGYKNAARRLLDEAQERLLSSDDPLVAQELSRWKRELSPH